MNRTLLGYSPNGVQPIFRKPFWEFDIDNNGTHPFRVVCKLKSKIDADISVGVTLLVAVALHHHRYARPKGAGEKLCR